MASSSREDIDIYQFPEEAGQDTTCCYARQDKFWVTGAPGGERWEIYTVLQDSATFWGQGGSHSWEAAEAALDAAPGTGAQAVRCCGGNHE